MVVATATSERTCVYYDATLYNIDVLINRHILWTGRHIGTVLKIKLCQNLNTENGDTCYLLLVLRVGFIGEGITPYLLSPLQQSPSQGGHADSLHHQLVTEASLLRPSPDFTPFSITIFLVKESSSMALAR